MHFPVLVVGQRVLLQSLCHLLIGDDHLRFRFGFDHQFQDVQQLPRIPPGIAEDGIGFLHLYVPVFQFRIRMDGPVEQLEQVVFLQRLEHIQLAAGEQWADDLERRVLRGGADEGNHARFDRSQQGVLLRLVETVDFIDEEDGAVGIEEPAFLGTLDDLTHLLDTRSDRTQGIERRFQLVGNDVSQGGLSHARRPPQDERRDMSGVDHLPEHGTRTDQMFLADVVVERPRAHSFC